MAIKAEPINTLNAINKESWEWLQENRPDYAEGVAADVAAHCTPRVIFYRVLDEVGAERRQIALRCRQAAEHLANGGGE